MANINEMAGAIAKETAEQGEKLNLLDENMTAADANVEDGVKELKQAAVHQKKAGRCMYFLVGVIFLCIIILGLFLFNI
jgi:t-SNARE complex subunit (syntaxin)|tara:strand:- start:172 stop:408 length:237 start_codon:yes stop_codon:yes gene_type:complete